MFQLVFEGVSLNQETTNYLKQFRFSENTGVHTFSLYSLQSQNTRNVITNRYTKLHIAKNEISTGYYVPYV